MNPRLNGRAGRVLGGGFLAAGLVALALCVYCFVDTASFVSGAKPLDATVVSLERTRYGREHATAGFRPVVSVQMPDGRRELRRFTGMYRVQSDAVGNRMTLLYNPAHPLGMAPDSPWNWIGSIVYGSVSAALVVIGLLLFTVRRPRSVDATVAP